MASNKLLNMIVKVTDKASKPLKDIKGSEGAGGVMGLSGALASMISPADMAIGAMGALVSVVKKGVSDFTETALEVGNLADSLQLTATDASFLQSVMDKYGVTNDTMVAAFRTMNREGMAPTLSNLKEMLETYDNISDSTKKMQYAQKMFGEQGLKQIIPMWERLNEEQRENFGLQEDGIKITRESIDAARELEKAQKDLEQAWINTTGWLLKYWNATANVTDNLRELVGLNRLVTEGEEKIVEVKGTHIDYLKKEHELQIEVRETMKWLDLATRIYAEGLSLETIQIWENVSAMDAQLARMRQLAGGLKIMAPLLRGGATMWDNIDPYALAGGYPGQALGGDFTVGGQGGQDSSLVSFMATPGETVSVGGGMTDNQQMLDEMRLLVRNLPIAIADAVERR